MAVIQAAGLSKIFPGKVTALEQLSVTVRRGEMVGVLGSSGAGKTTFFRLLNGTLRPSGGQLKVMGYDLSGPTSPGDLRRLRARVALINQQHNVIPALSVLQNVLIGRLGRLGLWRSLGNLVRPGAADQRRVLEALALVGLADKIYSRAEDLSGGQQQRVAVARAIAQGAEALLADEPIASVDVRNAALMLDLFRRLNQELGLTVVMNLHQLDFALRYCPRLLALQAGRLVYDGPPEGLNELDIYAPVGRLAAGLPDA